MTDEDDELQAWRMVRRVFDMDRSMLMRAKDAREAGKQRRADKEIIKGRGGRKWRTAEVEGQESMELEGEMWSTDAE